MPMKLNRMTIAELLAFHDREAEKRNLPKLGEWKGPRLELSERVKAMVAPKPRVFVRAAVLETLAKVTHYEHRTTGEQLSTRAWLKLAPAERAEYRSVGLPYDEVLRIVHERVPGAKTTRQSLRQTVAFIRAGLNGYRANLPGVRPRRCPH